MIRPLYFRIESPLDRCEVSKAIASRIAVRSSVYAREHFAGAVRGDGFCLHRAHLGMNSFLPVLDGRIRETAEGCILDVTARAMDGANVALWVVWGLGMVFMLQMLGAVIGGAGVVLLSLWVSIPIVGVAGFKVMARKDVQLVAMYVEGRVFRIGKGSVPGSGGDASA